MDIGVDQYLLDDRLTLSGGYFWNHYRDMILFQQNLRSLRSRYSFWRSLRELLRTKFWSGEYEGMGGECEVIP